MRIKQIKICDFLSIKEATLVFPVGKIELQGENRDILVKGLPSSNGAGKSSILLALQQGLYNRNYKVKEVNNVSNSVTQKAYFIEILLDSQDGIPYRITNDRNTMTLVVTNLKTKEILSTRIKDSLPIIEGIIGLSYQEFLLLTYMNSSTTSEIFTATDSNLILKFFNLSKLSTYLDNLKLTRRELNKELKRIQVIKSEYTTTKLVRNKEEIEAEYSIALIEKKTLTTTHPYTLMGDSLEEITQVSKKVQKLRLLKEQQEANLQLMTLGICPTCTQSIPSNSTEGDTERLNAIDLELRQYIIKLNDLNTRVNTNRASYQEQEGEINTKLLKLEAKLLSYRHIEEKGVEDIDKITADIMRYEHQIKIIKSAILTIESGKVHQAYLYTFLIGLNTNIQETLNLIGSRTTITSMISRGSILYNIIDNKIPKSTSMLSSGEGALYGLVIMVALFKTLQEQLGVTVNILMLDEAISNIDKGILQKIEELLETVKDKCIIITQHHNELPTSLFTDCVTIVKEGGLSSLKEVQECST